MPFIETKTSVSVSKEQLTALKEAFAKAIEIIPGKSEEWLMLNTVGDCAMAFRGDMDTPCAMIKVEIFGSARDSEYNRLTDEICRTASKILDVPSDRIYVRYEEVSHWGYDGFNF